MQNKHNFNFHPALGQNENQLKWIKNSLQFYRSMHERFNILGS
jgi:hypothetical protein